MAASSVRYRYRVEGRTWWGPLPGPADREHQTWTVEGELWIHGQTTTVMGNFPSAVLEVMNEAFRAVTDGRAGWGGRTCPVWVHT